MTRRRRLLLISRGDRGYTGPSTYAALLQRQLSEKFEVQTAAGDLIPGDAWDLVHLLDVACGNAHELQALKCPLVVDVHDYYWTRPYMYSAPDLPARWINAFLLARKYRTILRQAAAVVVHCDYVATRVPHPLVRNVGISVDTSDLASGEPIHRRRPIILFAGTNYFRKGFATLARAFRQVLNTVPSAELIVAGYERPHSLRVARALVAGLPVSFVGPQERASLAALYRAARVHVLPSAIEASPVTPLEAWACGTPTVASTAGGIPELLTHGVDSLLVQPGDAIGLAAYVTMLLCNPDRGARLVTAGRKELQSRFQPMTMVSRLESVYDQLVM